MLPAFERLFGEVFSVSDLRSGEPILYFFLSNCSPRLRVVGVWQGSAEVVPGAAILVPWLATVTVAAVPFAEEALAHETAPMALTASAAVSIAVAVAGVVMAPLVAPSSAAIDLSANVG